MFSSCFIEILDIARHHRCGYGFPCLFNNQTLSALLDSHFLREHIHDDQHNDREENRVILHLVYLEDDELFIKQRSIQVIIQNMRSFSTFIEWLENGGKIMDSKLYLLLNDKLRYSHQGELIIGIEGKFRNLETSFLALNLINLTLDTLEIVLFHEFRSQTLELVKGCLLFTLCSCSIFHHGL